MLAEQLQNLRVEIAVTTVESPLAFLQMKREGAISDAVKLLQAVSSKAPETINLIQSIKVVRETIFMNSKSLLVFDIHQPVIAMPAVIAEHDVCNRSAANDGPERSFFTVRYDFRIDVLVVFEKTEEGFTVINAAAALAAHAARAGMSFGQLHLARRER